MSQPKALNDYQLGDSLGKGAFGQVYRALNMATGETVAVKEIQLSNIPKAELGEIMSEIDLLKNLNHPNIVKYKGFVKTREYLYIILEFCENGSLHNICKRFGKFPENLVAVYISQVLEGLVYLHDQGVIHRDIKGANILTNKDGCVKLADFGVASSTTTGAVSNDAVVGSPYWMAPEVIEQSGATTASDIWSVGCVVIELLEGQPPYHNLDPMPALFRIVQDDCPPIPDGASPIVKDFLYHCFQKDCNLRISAKKLLRHPWMISARKQMSEDATEVISQEGKRPLSNYNFDEAVLKVQEWNEALRSPSRPSKHPGRTRAISRPESPTRQHLIKPSPLAAPSITAGPSLLSASTSAPRKQPANLVDKIQPLVLQPPEEQTDNWDDDFEEGISFTKLQGLEKTAGEPEIEDNAQTIKPNKSPGPSKFLPLAQPPPSDMGPIIEDYSDLGTEDDDATWQDRLQDFKKKNATTRGLFHPDDIKVFAHPLTVSPGPFSAPLPEQSLSRRPSRPSLATLTKPGSPGQRSSSSSSGRGSHSRSSSNNLLGTMHSNTSSWGRGDALKLFGDFGKYAEDDEEDYEDIFGKSNGAIVPGSQTLQLHTRLSNKSWLGDEASDDEDPFAEIDEGFSEDDLEANLQRDKHARLTSQVNFLIDELTPTTPNFQLREACDQLLGVMMEAPEMQVQLVSAHGMLAILEVLEGKCSRDVSVKLLQIINLLVNADIGFLESFCLIGGIPLMMGYTSKKYPSECRLEASHFIRLLCNTSVLTLQMFIACRGLKVLVDLLDEDYSDQAELVAHALNGISSVFELNTPTTKNDFCRMFIREGLLDPLSAALLNVMSSREPTTTAMKHKIIQILQVFSQVSQSDIHVRNALGTRKVIRRLLRACELLEPECLVQLLKVIKHLSMNPTLLDVLQNANAIEILVKILEEQSSGPYSTEMCNHIFHTCYNLCRLNKSRQEEAAQAGLIPCLQRVINSPLKQFALPMFCDMASAGKSCRSLLWQHDGLSLYLTLLKDPYFQASALESVLSWLQDEPARVEDELVKSESIAALLTLYTTASSTSFENILDPLHKFLRLSTPITLAISKSPQFFSRTLDKLKNSKAVVRLNLLRILRSVCDVHPNHVALVERYGLSEVVSKLAKDDAAVLVRELAREMIPGLEPGLSRGGKERLRARKPGEAPIKVKKMRRTASESHSTTRGSPLASLSGDFGTISSNGSTTRYGAPPQAGSRMRLGERHGLGDIPWQEPPGMPSMSRSTSGPEQGASRFLPRR